MCVRIRCSAASVKACQLGQALPPRWQTCALAPSGAPPAQAAALQGCAAARISRQSPAAASMSRGTSKASALRGARLRVEQQRRVPTIPGLGMISDPSPPSSKSSLPNAEAAPSPPPPGVSGAAKRELHIRRTSSPSAMDQLLCKVCHPRLVPDQSLVARTRGERCLASAAGTGGAGTVVRKLQVVGVMSRRKVSSAVHLCKVHRAAAARRAGPGAAAGAPRRPRSPERRGGAWSLGHGRQRRTMRARVTPCGPRGSAGSRGPHPCAARARADGASRGTVSARRWALGRAQRRRSGAALAALCLALPRVRLRAPRRFECGRARAGCSTHRILSTASRCSRAGTW
jgi:hypothetical protein